MSSRADGEYFAHSSPISVAAVNSSRRAHLFERLDVIDDLELRNAAMNMAIDEALLETVTVPSIRFYRWGHAALSFGYFGSFTDVSQHQAERDLVRRWTGGGIVFHGDDLTYAIVIPRADRVFGQSAPSIYSAVHLAMRKALAGNAIQATLADGGWSSRDTEKSSPDRTGLAGARPSNDSQSNSAIIDRRYSKSACFANPVRADVMVNGTKVAGAAQRRSRIGLLQQGSIQNVKLSPEFPGKFAASLSANCREQAITGNVKDRAVELAEQKYASAAWLRRR